jgi:hypothetical protein
VALPVEQEAGMEEPMEEGAKYEESETGAADASGKSLPRKFDNLVTFIDVYWKLLII